MKVQAYCAYQGVLIVTVATPRPETAGSAIFTAATIHEDFCAQVRVVLQEWKHLEPTTEQYPAAQRLKTYLPTAAAPDGRQLYAIRQLMPAGTPRDIDTDYQLEIMRIRYIFTVVLLPAAFSANQKLASGLERNIEKAVRDLFEANGVPHSFIPGDSGIRDEQDNIIPIRSEVDIICEMGPAMENGRQSVEIAAP